METLDYQLELISKTLSILYKQLENKDIDNNNNNSEINNNHNNLLFNDYINKIFVSGWKVEEFMLETRYARLINNTNNK
jgi:hypothetical protein